MDSLVEDVLIAQSVVEAVWSCGLSLDLTRLRWSSSSETNAVQWLELVRDFGWLRVVEVYGWGIVIGPPYETKRSSLRGLLWTHSRQFSSMVDKNVEPVELAGSNAVSDGKKKRKKLKGKRAVVRWLKFFRWKKKKEFERMTAEEKILYKLRKARKKEERFVEALKKIEPKESSETIHDPEILTPEEHFYFLKMGQKCKNYVPVGRRGIYQGVILNMHLHWKKHQTLKLLVKTFSLEEVKEIATELARLSGGIVLDIQEDNTIIMYRGKNYSQPPTEIMSPRTTLSRKKVFIPFPLLCVRVIALHVYIMNIRNMSKNFKPSECLKKFVNHCIHISFLLSGTLYLCFVACKLKINS
ncbi:unnamed protein product [Ilex paraguariensis]|uniref:CRM domain-containing protein n=1 Tax=Ilex paraguariensis TaxID=185542 RepID=A0ABC8R703_9AQUA